MQDHELTAALEQHWKYGGDKVVTRVAGLDGVALNGMDVAVECHRAGWVDALELAKALATFCSESLFYTMAFHHNLAPDGSILSTDWGPCQLNDKYHAQWFPGGDPSVIACNPNECFKAAHTVWKDSGGSFAPWYGWKNGVALDDYYVRRAGLAVMNYVARDLVQLAGERAPEIAGRKTPPTLTRVPMMSTHDLRVIYPPIK